MLISILMDIFSFCGVSLILCFLGVIISYYTQDSKTAFNLLNAWIFHFDGILIGGFGYGIMWFLKEHGKNILANIITIMDIPENNLPEAVKYSMYATSWKWKFIIGMPITFLGGFVLWNCVYPFDGFAKYYLAICSISIYFVGAYILSFYVFILLMFKVLETSKYEINVNKFILPLEFETLNNFLVITSFLGVVALYLGFRGTLTANFLYSGDMVFRKLLILPLFIFLPTVLVYSFFPRYAIRRIYENHLIKKIRELEDERSRTEMKEISFKDKIEIENLLQSIKEKILMERKQFPLLSLKDTPSLLLTIIIFIQYIMQNDMKVKEFLDLLLK
jgi:hypothetical protein